MLSYRRRAADDKDGLTSVFTASALFPSEFESDASRLRAVEGDRSGREREGDSRRLVESNVIGDLGGDLGRHDRVLLERGVPVIKVPLVQPENHQPLRHDRGSSENVHFVSYGEVRDALADGLHDARCVCAEDGGVLFDEEVERLDLPVDGVERGRVDLDEDFARTGRWNVALPHSERALGLDEVECLLSGHR